MGPLGIWGSGEFLPWSAEPDRILLEAAATGDGSVAVVSTASAPEGDEVFDGWTSMGVAHYESLGVKAFAVPLKTRTDATLPEVCALLLRASYIYLSGGNPAYLANTLRDTPFWETVLERRAAGAALAGCSAGACALGEQAPDPTASMSEDFNSAGLGVVPGTVFGAHWNMLDTYLPGLTEIIRGAVTDEQMLVGVDEDTAMLCLDGQTWRVVGEGSVVLYRPDQPETLRAGQTLRL